MMLVDYQLIEKLYESSNSQVYRARRQADGQPVILKLLKERYPSPERVAWFKREYQVTQSLDLPSVVKAYTLTNDQHQWLMVLEDFGGESLARLALAGRLALPDFLKLAIQITEIVGQLHRRQLIHKDLNPANIVFNPITQQLKLIDFGISTGLSQEKPAFRDPNVLEGTLPYISPEQTGRMNRAIDYRTDFYSLGVTFYELLAGQLPFQVEAALELIHSHIARQPQPPHLLQPEVPPLLSEIILKLMAKNAEDRYQSAHGLKADLQRCLSQWTMGQRLDPFPLGQEDISDRLQLPQKLYGREQAVETLLSTFEQASATPAEESVKGKVEFLLVSGQAGVGKSALVQEIYKPLTRWQGYFVTGKFDQFRRNIPFSAFIGAFRELVRQLLTEDEARLERWRNRLLAGLGQKSQLLSEAIPEIELIIGPQPPLSAPEAAEAQQRFTQLWQNFIDIFTGADHPLIIFLDDLQWADSASLKLLEQLVPASDSSDLFFIGAYRDNEVRAGHPLQLTLDEMTKRGAAIHHIPLTPLDLPPIVELAGDLFSLAPEEVLPLARLILAKTAGNPFFINEFLKSLHRAALVRFDPDRGRWHWNLAQIQAQAITGNVVELITGNVQKLPAGTQAALKLAACLGGRFQLQTLALVSGKSASETAADLWPALAEGLIFPLDEAYKLVEVEPTAAVAASPQVDYKFAHDRIHQAVYSLIGETERAKNHWQIGQLLLQHGAPAGQEEQRFELVNQLNSGRSQARDQSERDYLAAFNLSAAQKAKAAAAYEPAFKYILTGLELLIASEGTTGSVKGQEAGAGEWQRQYDLALELHLEAVELAYLNADFELMEQLAEVTLRQAQDLLHEVKVYEVKIQAYNAQSQIRAAIKTALSILELLGVPLPERPSRAEALRILEEARHNWAGRHIEQLIDLPEMTDPYKLAAMRLLSSVSSAAYQVGPALHALVVLQQVNLTINYGYAPTSVDAYSGYGLVLCGFVGDIETGHRFGRLALQFLDRFKLENLRAAVLLVFNNMIRHWKEPLRNTLPSLLEGYSSGLEQGDLEYALFALRTHAFHLYATGHELPEVAKKMAAYIEIITPQRQTTTLHRVKLYRQTVLNLIGDAEDPCRLMGESYDEAQMLPLHLAAEDRGTIAIFYTNKLILCYLFQRYEEAVGHADKARPYLDGQTATFTIPLFHFYDSLARLALYPTCSQTQQKRFLKRVSANQAKMKGWAELAPMNHLHKLYLVEAERSRVLGRDGQAREYYDQALALAVEHDYMQEAALAGELAGRFYWLKVMPHFAGYYLSQALYHYERWGAGAKVAHLKGQYPDFWEQAALTPFPDLLSPPITSTARSAAHGLDLTSVIKASQAISGEIVIHQLLERLMEIVIENAGAQKGYLILENEGTWHIEAAGGVAPANPALHASIPLIEAQELLPASVLNYVIHTHKPLVLSDASREEVFRHDRYINRENPRSLLCAPLLKQSKLIGLIYLENNLTPGAFTPDRLTLLNILAAQAAISIENASLYTHLEELVEARTVELVQANESLKAGNAELDAFARTVAHDLKNPLSIMIGYGDYLLEDMAAVEIEEIEEIVQKIKQTGHKMINIINELLLLAGVRKGAVKVTPLDMAAVVAQARQRLALMIENSGAKLCLPETWPAALGYGPWIEEVWANYLSNGLKYGGRPPLLQLGATVQTDGMIRFWLQDNGPGLTPEASASLFTEFTRLETTRAEGHGLGLSIVRRIIEKLGGEVGVDSEGVPGQGASFYFTLPPATGD